MNTQKQIFLIVTLLFMMTAGCAAYAAIELPYRQGLQEDYMYEGRVERGALLYANNCRTCHGNAGEGGVGLPLNTEAFKDQSPLALAANQQMLRHTIQCGRASTVMPAWLKDYGGALSRIQVEHLVEFLTQEATEEYPEGKTNADGGQSTSKGWLHAEEFAHNLNAEASAVVGGDSLSGIAKQHNIGAQELYDANEAAGHLEFQDGQEPGLNALLKRGSKVRLLPINSHPQGYEYLIRQDNETIQKIADSQSIGAIILAELNGIPYKMDYKTGLLTLLDVNDKVSERPGLLPGTTLELPDNTTYTVNAGDTIADIADKHSISTNALVSANRDVLGSLKNDDEIESVPHVELPNGTKVIVQAGDTLATIAAAHGMELQELADLNDRGIDADVNPGETLNLPNGTLYTVQAGDTVGKIASMHGLQASRVIDELNLEGANENTVVPVSVILNLPKINDFKVEGDSLQDIVDSMSGTATVADFAEKNEIPENAVLYIGTSLHLPENVWGSTPPDAVNLGTGCLQYAVPNSVYEGLISPPEPVEKPASRSNNVTLFADASSWVVQNDGGAESEPNRGAALIAVNTTVNFIGRQGIHNIWVNQDEYDTDFRQGETTTFTFREAGEFTIECTIHPGMLAYIWVE